MGRRGGFRPKESRPLRRHSAEMMKGLFVVCWVALGVASAGCSADARSAGTVDASSAGARDVVPSTGGSGGAASSGGAGGSRTGGSGGALAGYGGAGGSAGSGAATSSGGKDQSTGGSGGDVADASSSGGVSTKSDSGTDAGDPSKCGADYCVSTTCVGLACGYARCCRTELPVCVHGATRCPGEPAQATLQCRPGSPARTATFDKSCTQDTDCIVVEHWNGCCSASDISLKASEKQSFDAFEQSCGGQPACGCCCDRVYAEDGYGVTAPATARAVCFQGACMAVG